MARRRCISPAGTTSSAPGSPATGPPHRKRPASPTSIPVLQSPKKKRRAKAEKSDLDIWDENDNDIIGISLHNLNRHQKHAGLQHRNLDWLEDDRAEVKRVVRQRWTESYAPLPSPTSTVTSAPSTLQRTSSTSKWATSYSEDEATFISPDSIEAYLDAACVSRTEILAAGGVLQYWENARVTRPRLAQWPLISSSSVDAERAFSGGRLQVNYLQHGISSQTFKAQVAVGLWFNTPLMPDLSVAMNIMRQKMAKGKEKEAGRLVSAKSTVIDIM
ncbi:hypothetical protein BDR06DRAFT_1009873 [Suillus hirtellus]|nr:hypothetical protein BDR06DRAFT_1009873 [Suillus hirtellus]